MDKPSHVGSLGRSSAEESAAPLPRKCSPQLRQTAEQVFREHAGRIYNVARRMLPSDADADDVTQNVLVQVIRKLPDFRGEAAITTWLHRVTVNTALSYRRSRARYAEQQTGALLDTLEEKLHMRLPAQRWRSSPPGEALGREQQQQIADAIARLPDIYRDVFVLADIEGLSNADVGELVELSVPAVKSRLHRARLLLRDALAPYFEEVGA